MLKEKIILNNNMKNCNNWWFGFFGEYLINFMLSKNIECLSIDINSPEKNNQIFF